MKSARPEQAVPPARFPGKEPGVQLGLQFDYGFIPKQFAAKQSIASPRRRDG